MTTPQQILVTLAQSRATTASIGETCRVPFLVAEAMLTRLAKDGLTAQVPDPILSLWEVTESGREAAAALTQPATA